jgi:lysophospholipase L1-like esterase
MTLAATIFVVALEIALRIYNPLPFRVRGDHIVLPVHQSYAIAHQGAIKLDPVTYVTKNSLGFRGPEPPRDWARRLTILTIGGSTTECLFLSDGRTWTDRFTRRLEELRPDAWVNNAGFEGHSTFGHLVLLRQYVLNLRPTVAIVLAGVNDMKIAAARPRDDELSPGHFSAAHRALTFVADHSEIAAVAENLVRMRRSYRAGLLTPEVDLRSLEPRFIAEDHQLEAIEEHRTKFVPGFGRRLREIVDLTRQRGIEPVLMTQPALYGDIVDPTTGIPVAELKVDPNSNGHLEWRLLEIYNDMTRAVSREKSVRLVDLAREMPKDSKLFTDWVHYTNEGATVVGDIVFARLGPWLRSLRAQSN